MDASSSSSTPTPALPPTSSSGSTPPLRLRNPKYRHISRSAAKRESVQLLGSIKDLQLHFSGAGLEHRAGAGVGVKGAPGLGSLGEVGEEEENRPPALGLESSAGMDKHKDKDNDKDRNRERQERRPWKEVALPRVDLEQARIEARSIISHVRGIWGLSIPTSPSPHSALPSSKSLYFPTNLHDAVEARTSEDIQTALVTTAQSIRRIRFLALSISHATAGRQVSGSLLPPRLGGAGKLRSSLSTPSRPSGSGSGPPRAVSAGSGYGTEKKPGLGRGEEQLKDDVLGELRRAALEVLTALRALEERLRLQASEEQALDSVSDERSPTPTPTRLEAGNDDESTESERRSRDARPDSSSASTSDGALFSEPEGYYDSDEDSLFNVNAVALAQSEERQTTTWEDRIVSESREYRVMSDDEWEKEARGTREGVGRWVGVVERLFVFAPSEEGELEDWARDEGWDGKDLERIHSFLLSHLPLDLALRLPAPSTDNFAESFLTCLSDGYILIHAYNSSLLQSSKPWGFIPDSDVHDTLSSAGGGGGGGVASPPLGPEEGGKKEREWTFRRVDNLTCFGAALRHRYQIPIIIPSSTSSSSLLPLPSGLPPRISSPAPAAASTTRAKPSIVTSPLGSASGAGKREETASSFDPMIIAKRAPGWEGMLTVTVQRWVVQVSHEIREARGRNLPPPQAYGRGGMI